jgi:hypothetical protein
MGGFGMKCCEHETLPVPMRLIVAQMFGFEKAV